MRSASQIINAAEKKADIAFTLADARAKSIKHIKVTSASPLGTLIQALAINGDVHKSVADIESELLQEVSDAVAMLDEALKEADNLLMVADYLDGAIPRLDVHDFNLMAQAKCVREAHLAGIIDASAIAADIRRYINEATAEVKRVQAKWAPAALSGAKVAGQNIRAKALAAIDDPKAEYAAQKLVRLRAVHSWRYGHENRAKRQRRAERRASR
jgi:hypothetical protein